MYDTKRTKPTENIVISSPFFISNREMNRTEDVAP